MNYTKNSLERKVMNELKQAIRVGDNKRAQLKANQLDTIVFGELVSLDTASAMAECSSDFLLGLASDPDSIIKIYNKEGEVKDFGECDNPMFRTDEILSAKNWNKTKVA